MIEHIELRIREEVAAELLPDSLGRKLSSGVRVVRFVGSDPLLDVVRRESERLRRQGAPCAFYGWQVSRRYTEEEYASATMLQVEVERAFEPSGEECGTEYDEGGACGRCGAGARQATPLRLRPTSIPRNVGFARTIGGEIVVARHVVDLLATAGVTGVRTASVLRHGAGDSEFDDWRQLITEGGTVRACSPTLTGDAIFEEADIAVRRCACGQHLGHAVISELFVARDSLSSSEMQMTHEAAGIRSGLLRPRPLILIAPRVRDLLVHAGIRGFSFEVVHVV